MRYVYLLVFTFFLAPPAMGQAEPDSPAQRIGAQPDRGMVWSMPDRIEHGLRDLVTMRRMGVEAVRTSVIRQQEILTLADTLGLSLYVDLPVARHPAPRLLDTLDYATAILDTVLGLAQIHPSIRNVGLARHVDVTDTTACEAIERLARHARREGPPGLRVYYLTRFATGDRCAASVDFVLLDVLNRDDPIGELRRRVSASGESAEFGVGALGTWVRSDSLSGLRVEASPETQGRYFERHLSILLSDTLSISPRVIFVHRWRDVQVPHPNTAHDLEEPYMQRFGLLTLRGVERPAYDVVEGIYTGRQSTFAFSGGQPLPGRAPWSTLFGWALIAVLGTFYALSPRFRHMVPRYFGARFFYRDAVREGRDVLFGASTVLIFGLSAACGLTANVVLDILRKTDPFMMAVRWLPEGTQDVVVTLLTEPHVLLVLSGCTYALAIILWTFVLSLLSRRRYPIAPGQALMLVVWPRWPLLLVMVAAMVAESLPDADPSTALLIVAAWILISILSVLRSLIDFFLVTRVSILLLIPALIFNPGVIAAGVLIVVLLPFQPEVQYLWNMATRT